MSKNLKTEAVDHLFDAILCLKDRAECYTFFEDVCTVNELFSLSQRFEVARNTRLPVRHLRIFLMRIRNFFTHSALSAC